MTYTEVALTFFLLSCISQAPTKYAPESKRPIERPTTRGHIAIVNDVAITTSQHSVADGSGTYQLKVYSFSAQSRILKQRLRTFHIIGQASAKRSIDDAGKTTKQTTCAANTTWKTMLETQLCLVVLQPFQCSSSDREKTTITTIIPWQWHKQSDELKWSISRQWTRRKKVKN